MNKEIWKDIVGYEGLYQISNYGRIKSLERTIQHKTCYGGLYHVKGRILKPKIEKDGYFRISLIKDGMKKYYRLNRLVAQAFIPNPNELPIVNHKDEDKLNNNVNNLEWCTQKYNVNYGDGINKRKNKMSIKIIQYDLEDNYIKTWNSINDAVRHYNGNTQICQCCKGKRNNANGYKWKYTDEELQT